MAIFVVIELTLVHNSTKWKQDVELMYVHSGMAMWILSFQSRLLL